ncbi:MAG: hypothetical protein ABIU07_07080, partial [Ramlibacter sp.]
MAPRVKMGSALRLYLGLAALVVMSLATSAGMLAGALLLPRDRQQRYARNLTSLMFRSYLGAMQRVGAL